MDVLRTTGKRLLNAEGGAVTNYARCPRSFSRLVSVDTFLVLTLPCTVRAYEKNEVNESKCDKMLNVVW